MLKEIYKQIVIKEDSTPEIEVHIEKKAEPTN